MKKKIEKSTWIKISVIAAIAVAILILDLVTKYVFDGMWAEGQGTTVIPYLFNFVIEHNKGASFSLFEGRVPFLIAISIVFLGIFTWYFCKEKKKTWLLCVAYAFLVGGCLGNLYDRIVFGYVRDFIQFDFWKSFAVFNFADVFLTFGVVLFVIYIVIIFVKDYRKSKENAIKIGVPNENDEENSESEKSTESKKSKKIGKKSRKNGKKLEKTQKNEENEKIEEKPSEESDD